MMIGGSSASAPNSGSADDDVAAAGGGGSAALATTDGTASDFVVLTTFAFKHGVSKTAVTAGSLEEFEEIVRCKLGLPTEKYDLKFVNSEGQLLALDSVDFSTLSACT